MAGTVTVACKIPSGIVLRVFVSEKQTVNVMGGGVKDISLSRPTAWFHRLNGPAHKVGQSPVHQSVHGVALTHGVDADQYAIWLAQNKDSDVVTKGLVFANVKAADVVDQALKLRDEKTGLEAIDPQNMPAEFKQITTAAAA